MNTSNNTNTASSVDLLKIKIDEAKSKLAPETIDAISAIDWRAVIESMRESKGYNFEQLGNLELETELVLCGLTNPADYQKELQNRMRIPQAEAIELVNEMNIRVFQKIKGELIKNAERNKASEAKNYNRQNTPVVKSMGPTMNTSDLVSGMTRNDANILSNAGIEMKTEKILGQNSSTSADVHLENREDLLKGIENPNNNPNVKNESEKQVSVLAKKLSTPFQMPVTTTQHSINNVSTDSFSAGNSKIDPYREIPE